ncbi:hypothetical protein GCM10009119_18040 [Algoriphagus jejuensis]|uniref:Suppressor of fused-like domain-containing protein n=1 Tax=Algoriphagus jejuensis TaxID=419934 RepID=A0ABN1MZI0_9BACT
MSHIDSFKHELVGYLGYLPVYHPLEEIEGDFACDPSQLLLGGGSGEHPALVIENPTSAVAFFLREEIKTEKNLKSWERFISPYLDKTPNQLLTFYEWDSQRHSTFLAMSRSEALPNPNEKEDFEMWLILGIGEFVFFSLPSLAKGIMDRLEAPYKHFKHMRYNNIMVVPPNMPVYANGGNAFFR